MLKYSFALILLLYNPSFSQDIFSEKEFLDKLTIFSCDSNHVTEIQYKSNKLLEYSELFEIKINSLKEDNIESQLIKFDICLLRSYSCFDLAQRYFEKNSYSYGIQLVERGLDNLKKSLVLFDKCKNIIPDFDEDEKRLKILYDFCFNYYCEYKMNGKEEFQLFEKYKDLCGGLKDIKIINWLNNYYKGF
jgi:hypothetical protein